MTTRRDPCTISCVPKDLAHDRTNCAIVVRHGTVVGAVLLEVVEPISGRDGVESLLFRGSGGHVLVESPPRAVGGKKAGKVRVTVGGRSVAFGTTRVATPSMTLDAPRSDCRARDVPTLPLQGANQPRQEDGPTLAPGTVVADAYELCGLLGSGGMAQVFDAHDLSLDRRVAIKIARPAAYAALRAEGRALATLHHESIVSVLHAGDHRGVAYLVMEYVSGAPLRRDLDEHERAGTLLPIDAAMGFLSAIAVALSVVHEGGLSHRDVKPDNVMLAPRDRVVLMDFGLARPEFSAEDFVVGGSPAYMAPEVISRTMKAGEGHLVDLYSLGVVAYELLVGRTPFCNEDYMWTLRAHQFQAPPDPRERRSDLPDRLADLVLRLLAKRPADRPESAELVRWALHDIATGARRSSTAPP